MQDKFEIQGRRIGPGQPVYIVAELSANHHQAIDQAFELIYAAHKAGADAVKLQTYTPDTLTIDSDAAPFQIKGGTVWDGRTLYDLYKEAYTPWDWQPELKRAANELGLALFSSPFDFSAVEFLESMDVPAYKIASFEIVDLPLIERVASTGKPLIISTGMATLDEIQDAVQTARDAGATEIALLKCTSSYPAQPGDMNLRTIPSMSEKFGVPVGLSDHTLSTTVAVAAVSLGAALVEKHLTLSREDGGPDAAFSLEPSEFKEMVDAIRTTEQALGRLSYGPTAHEAKSLEFRRSLFIVEDMTAGEPLTARTLRSIRPANGLAPRYYAEVLGRKIARDVERGTPLTWDLIR